MYIHTYIHTYNTYIRINRQVYTVYTYIHTYIHMHKWTGIHSAYIHTYIRINGQVYMVLDKEREDVVAAEQEACIHIHTNIHACIHAYIHTYIHTHKWTGIHDA